MKELAYERRFREWLDEQQMSGERLRYPRDAAGGAALAYRFTPAAPPHARVLIAHGGGNDALFSFPGFFKQLLSRGFEVFTFDLDGHGRSSTTCFSADAVSGAVEAALEQAGRARPDLPTHALGISLGGSVLLHTLPRLGDIVRSAILISAPLRIEFSLRGVAGELGFALVRTALRQREHLGLWGLVPSFGPVKRQTYPLRLAENAGGAFGYVDILNGALIRMDLEGAAGRVPMPVLLVYGTADRLVPVEQGETLRRLIPDAELLVVEGGTHLTTFFAETAVGRVGSWLGRE